MPNIRKSDPIDVATLLSRGRIEIPQYQRSYSWTEREITEFLEDLFGAINHTETWFLGIIYTYNSSDENSHARKLTSLLLDGQQRLTTLFILLKELTVYHEIIPDLDVADAIKSYANATLTSLIFETGTDIPRFSLDEANQSEFSQYLLGTSRDESTFEFYKSGDFAKSHELLNDGIQLVRNWLEADFDRSRGTRDELERFKTLVKFILYEIELIEIQLDNQASFYNIFENINDRGRRLTDSDKFKNRYCSLIPKNHIPQFETDWFNVSKGVYRLRKDFDKDLFGFYFRSTGVDDLKEGGFYRQLRVNIQAKEGKDRTDYIILVWDRVKEMLRLLNAIEGLELIRLLQGSTGNVLVTDTKVVSVLVRNAWKCFDQFGVIAYALFFNFRQRNDPDAYHQFLTDLLNSVRFYMAATLMEVTPNTIRDYTIEIAKRLGQGKSLTEILADDGELDFASRFKNIPIERLSQPSNEVSRMILVFLQAHLNREVLEHYDASQSWTLEHLMPKGWEDNWSSSALINWDDINNSDQFRLSKQVQKSDLERSSKHWIQQLLGNKFVLSWKQNNDVRNDGFAQKKERILDTPNGIVMPTLAGSNIGDYKSFGIAEIIERTQTLRDKLEEAIGMREIPS